MQKLSPETLGELDWRDWAVRYLWGYRLGQLYEKVTYPLPEFLKREILTLANLITLYGLVTLSGSIFAMFAWFYDQPINWKFSIALLFVSTDKPPMAIAFYLLLETFVTDFFDGPMARLNNRVSALGTFLDHFRDYKAAFVAFAFLMIVTASVQDHRMMILEILALLCFVGILIYHAKLLWIKYKNSEFVSENIKDGVKKHINFFHDFALNEYQTELSGRVHFFMVAFSVCAGIFYYFNSQLVYDIIFVTTIGVCLIVSGWYLNSTHSAYVSKLYYIMQEISDRLKQKVTDKTLEIREKISEKKEISRWWWVPNTLTIFRALAFLPLLITINRYPYFSIGFFILAAATDRLDGLIARWKKVESEFGEKYDPIADKFLILGSLLALWDHAHPQAIIILTFLFPIEFALGFIRTRFVRNFLGNSSKAKLIGKIKMTIHCVMVIALMYGSAIQSDVILLGSLYLGLIGIGFSFASLCSHVFGSIKPKRRPF